jgi:uncharacterized membrane protein YGL010W
LERKKVNQDPVDLIGLFVALFALAVSKEVAALLGPYAAIIVLACAGAAVSLSSTDKVMTAGKACWYVTWRVLLAVAVTVSAAQILEALLPERAALILKPRYTIAPIAFFLGWFPNINDALTWAVGIAKRLFERKTDGQ